MQTWYPVMAPAASLHVARAVPVACRFFTPASFNYPDLKLEMCRAPTNAARAGAGAERYFASLKESSVFIAIGPSAAARSKGPPQLAM